jgi:ketosteroid isomerase-like protein
MPKARKHASLMSSTPDEIEAAFYESLQTADLARMMECWADDDDVICIHPAGGRISGIAAIRSAFEAIFSQTKALNVKPQHTIKSDAMDCVVHSVVETIEVSTETGPITAYVMATNIYRRTPKGWRMVLHHASPTSSVPEFTPQPSQQILH